MEFEGRCPDCGTYMVIAVNEESPLTVHLCKGCLSAIVVSGAAVFTVDPEFAASLLAGKATVCGSVSEYCLNDRFSGRALGDNVDVDALLSELGLNQPPGC